MKKCFVFAVLLTFLSVSRIEAQVLRSDRPVPDSLIQSYHDAFVEVHDIMLGVRTTASRASRDLTTTSYVVVVSRIDRLRRACDLASAVTMEQAAAFDSRAAPQHLTEMVGAVGGSLRALSESITSECSMVFTAELVSAPDSLTAWGPYHISRLQRLEREYLGRMHLLAKATGFRFEPSLGR